MNIPTATSGRASVTSVSTETTHRRPPRWVGPFLLIFIIGIYALGFFTNATAPELLKRNPTLLMALNPRYRYMVVAAPEVDPIPFFLIGWLRLLFSDPVYFALGWFYGDRAIQYFNDALGEQTVSKTREFFLKAAPVMAMFFAGPVICVLAGASRMKVKTYFVLNMIGTAIIVVALRAFSNVLEGPIQAFLRFNDRNSRWLMIITIATTVIIVARVGARQVKAAKSLSDDIEKS
jgi:membrane protein DedA with SNARE-associated domain